MKGNALLGAAAAFETRAQGKFVETRVILEEGFSQAAEFVQPARRRTEDHGLLLYPLFPSEKEAFTPSSPPGEQPRALGARSPGGTGNGPALLG